MGKILCFILGHYTGTWREDGISIFGFGGFISSVDSKGLRHYCLRCNKIMPIGFRRLRKKG